MGNQLCFFSVLHVDMSTFLFYLTISLIDGFGDFMSDSLISKLIDELHYLMYLHRVHDLISINLYLASKTQCSSQGQLLHNFSNSIMAINVARNLGILEPLHSHRLLIMTMEGLVQIFGLECTRWKLEIQLFPWHLIMIYLPDLLYLLFRYSMCTLYV